VFDCEVEVVVVVVVVALKCERIFLVTITPVSCGVGVAGCVRGG
jgi:hypothetical protein